MARKKYEAPEIEEVDNTTPEEACIDTNKLLLAMQGISDLQVQLVDEDYLENVPVKHYVSTTDPVLDMIIGGGIPVGKQIEIIGFHSAGKTTLAQHILNELINNHNGYAYLMDVEDNSWDFPQRNIQLGMNPAKANHVTLGVPETLESAFSSMDVYLETMLGKFKVKEPIFIILDSLAALSTRDESNKQYGEMGYQKQAGIVAQGHRKLRTLLRKYKADNVSFIFLNQAKKGIQQNMYAPAEIETYGGNAPKFFSAIRIMMERGKKLELKVKEKAYPVGIISKVKVVKNKLFNDNQTCTLNIMGRKGVDSVANLFNWLTLTGAYKTRTAKEMREDTNEATKSFRYKMQLADGEQLIFDTGAIFRALYSQKRESILNTVQTNYINTIEKVSQMISGYAETEIEQGESEQAQEFDPE